MAANRTAQILLVFSIFLGAACAGGISQQARSQVTYAGTFSALQENPDHYSSEIVLLGGRIIETDASQGSSEITVLQLPLGRNDRPKDLDQSKGRFLVRSGQFLDPAIHRKGILLTVVGRLNGSEVRPIGGFDYAYPIVEAIEIKRWPHKWAGLSNFHFGIAIGTSF